ncbi:hypothetical protein K227x_07620 [Rubripirellula lacrimiformis]|uniref:Uncharacterized protein n=1 Tax=Rubripirellula lacrimiformis TaxID=1930273 RepID=A0A517N5G8_9BACT|nr:hypothetical protein K227x_07620 [Rubripirellula lacrimiformis]
MCLVQHLIFQRLYQSSILNGIITLLQNDSQNQQQTFDQTQDHDSCSPPNFARGDSFDIILHETEPPNASNIQFASLGGFCCGTPFVVPASAGVSLIS